MIRVELGYVALEYICTCPMHRYKFSQQTPSREKNVFPNLQKVLYRFQNYKCKNSWNEETVVSLKRNILKGNNLFSWTDRMNLKKLFG